MSAHSNANRFSRRRFLTVTAGALGATAASAILPGCAPQATPAPPTPTAAEAATPTPAPAATPTPAAPTATPTAAVEMSDFGVPYPPDAGPKELQYHLGAATQAGTGWKAMDFYEAVYARGPFADHFAEPLVRLTKDFELAPGTAEHWEVSEDGTTWTFYLEKGLMWSDGNEVTADDYVATFRYAADPKHAFDFTWYWMGVIKNFTECCQGSVPLEQLGVRVGADKYQFVVETEEPTPYLPAMMLYSWPLSAKGLEKYGSGIYNTNPATCISSGPFILEEWTPDRRVSLKANPKYTGKLRPLINRKVAKVVSGGSDMARYQAYEVDSIGITTPADIKIVMETPELKARLMVNPGDFRTFYLFFDVNTPPWNDLRVRKAFAKAVDRVSIVNNILAPLAIPAYSFLMPGFPDANSEGLKPIQDFNPEEARKLLSDAGYPDGKGFPKVTLYVRGGGPATDPAVTQAVAASIQQVLNVQIDLQTLDMPTFMAKLNAKPTEIPFGWISYGMDYFDATNMLGVWLSGGRHSWKNEEFDRLVREGGRITDDPQKRSEAMKEAERILVEDCPAVFVYHQLIGQLWQPWVLGEWQSPNKFGYTGMQWIQDNTGGFSLNSMYMGKDVTKRKP